mgnify:CR=1 FL=1
MPPIETAHRNQDAVYWPVLSVDFYGEYTHSVPEDIKVRWEWVHKERLDPKGITIAIDAEVVANKVLAEGSLLWLGTYESWLATGSSGDATKLMQVSGHDELKDIKGRSTRHTAELMRYKGGP